MTRTDSQLPPAFWAERMVLVACRLTLCMGGCWVREWSLGGAHQL